jgi:Uma2 family endonuclease
MLATLAPPERRVLLHDISWDTYQRLLAESPEACGTRFTYDNGELEIMTVSIGHEAPNRKLAHLAEITAEETGRDFEGAGSTTFQRKDLAKGFEPDSCFYFRHAAAIRGREKLDLAVDPPPELIIEVDITSSSLDRFAIFAAMGVAEVGVTTGNASNSTRSPKTLIAKRWKVLSCRR